MLGRLSVADIEATIDGALYREARLDDRASRLCAELLTAAGSHPKDQPDKPITPEMIVASHFGRELLPFDPRSPSRPAPDLPVGFEPDETGDKAARARLMVAEAQAKAAMPDKVVG